MSKFLFTAFSILFIITLAASQGGKNNSERNKRKMVTLIGTVIDQSNQAPLEFATVSVFEFSTDRLIGGGVTNENGEFSFQIEPNSVKIIFEFISYQSWTIDKLDIGLEPKHDLGNIELSTQGIELEGVEIRAEKSETQFSLDKRTFNVGKDLANRGGTAEDILDNVPSVTVDIEGAVSLRGSEGVRILVDGRPSSLTGGGLKSIAANMIDRIEVITNPSARYEAEGMAGIINIVLKKDQGHGFNGAFNANVGLPTRYGAGANLNYRKGSLNWFLNYGYTYRNSPGFGSRIQERTIDNDVFILDQNSDRSRNGYNQSIRFGLDYFLSKKEQLTGSFLYRLGNQENITDIYYDDYLNERIPANLIDNSFRKDTEDENRRNQEYNINYRKEFTDRKHYLNASVLYTERFETEISDIIQTFTQGIDPINQYSYNDSGYETLLFQVDYIHPIAEDHKWETGLRSSLRDVSNDFYVGDVIGMDTIPREGLVNNFFYNEDIHAAYFIYGNTFGIFSYQLGIRSEYSDIQTELPSTDNSGISQNDYFNFFPSGHFNYKIDDSNSWQISYSRRINRPRFWDLNPFFAYTDNRNIRSGNPILNPEYTDSYELSNIKIWETMNLTGSLFYRKTNNAIQRVKIINNVDGIALAVPLNMGKVDNVGLDLNGSFNGIKWLRLDGNFSFFKNIVTVEEEETQPVLLNYFRTVQGFTGTEEEFDATYGYDFSNSDRFTWNGRLTARFSFWKSDIQLRGNYRAPLSSAQGRINARGSLDIGWSKDFLNRNLTLTFSVKDLFNSRKRNYTIDFEDYYENGIFQWRSRYADLSASYRINQKKKKGGRDRF